MDSLFTISCPSCSRQLRLPAAAMGKNVKCPVCQAIFKADSAENKSAPPPPEFPGAVTRKPSAPPEPPVDELRSARRRDDETEEGLPRRGRVDDDDDDRPRRRKDKYDDYDDRDDRPRRRRDEDDDEWSRRRRSYDDDDDYFEDRAYRRKQRRIDDAISSVAGPAIVLIVLGFLELAASLFLLFLFMVIPGRNQEDKEVRIVFMVIGLVGIFWGGLLTTGAFMMKTMKSYTFAMIASIMALVPFPCGIFNVGIGIWSIIVMSDANVKRVFEQNQNS